MRPKLRTQPSSAAQRARRRVRSPPFGTNGTTSSVPTILERGFGGKPSPRPRSRTFNDASPRSSSVRGRRRGYCSSNPIVRAVNTRPCIWHSAVLLSPHEARNRDSSKAAAGKAGAADPARSRGRGALLGRGHVAGNAARAGAAAGGERGLKVSARIARVCKWRSRSFWSDLSQFPPPLA